MMLEQHKVLGVSSCSPCVNCGFVIYRLSSIVIRPTKDAV